MFLLRILRIRTKTVSASLVLALLISSTLFGISKSQAEELTVVINELLWMGSSSSTADEWIELRNLTDQPVDLTNWRLTKLSSGAEVAMLTIPAGKSIPAQGYFLMSNYAMSSASSSLNIEPQNVDTDVALNNSALQIKLYDVANVLQDTADDGAGNPLSGHYVSSEKIFRSMERNPVPGDGTLVENWHIASRGVGFKEGKIEFGTPGSVNSNGLPIANAGPDQKSVIGESVNFDGTESSDPENQALTFGWNFGDMTTSAEITPSHAYAAAGEYTVTLSVSDGIDIASDTMVVTITSAPAAAPIAPANTGTPDKPTPTPSAPITSNTSCRGVTITEIFPNPAGVDDGEFVEFYNPTKAPIPLQGCILWLNEKRKAVLKDVTIAPKKYVVLEKSVTKLSLVNTGGLLKLVDTDGAELLVTTYPKSLENESWALVGKEWTWTNRVTPAAKNLAPVDDEDEASSVKKQVDDEKPQSVGLSDIQTIEVGTLVSLRGVVTVTPDILGTRTIWLQSETGAVSAVLPEGTKKITSGDEVSLIGKVRMSQGRKRVAVEKDGVQILGVKKTVEPKTISLDQLSAEMADVLVSVSGLINSSSGAKFIIDDGTAEGDVYIKSSTGMVKPRSASGDRLIATGIVSVTTAGIRILPRNADDLRVERVLGAATTAPTATKSLPTAPANQSMWYWALVAAGVIAAAAKPLYQYLRKKPVEQRVEI